MPKIGRNDKCSCGSGKKYKHCCGARTEVLEEVFSAARTGLEYDEKLRKESLSKLQEIIERRNLKPIEKKSAKVSLAQAHQRLGEHHTAIKILNSIDSGSSSGKSIDEPIVYLRAISFWALGDFESCTHSFDALREQWQLSANPQGDQRRIRGFQLLEAGKAYKSNGQNLLARECWEKAASYLASFGEQEHIYRAMSNLAFLDLGDADPVVQEKGVDALENLTRLKLRIGDVAGAATNYCNLGTYYRDQKRYERAIAYYRQDLYLSRLAGDRRELASTLGNLATLYAQLKQFSPARELLREAQSIGEELRDDKLIAITDWQLNFVNDLGREAGMAKEAMGRKAICMCDSGKIYDECCGRADFEPIDLPMIYGGMSEDVKNIRKEFADEVQFSPLDFILRKTSESQRRRAWCEVGVHDGWASMNELPDMANIHLLSAKVLASRTDGNDDISNALAALLLSVCHLEAFINQISFFLYEHRNDTKAIPFGLPSELLSVGPLSYQRSTSLESKWYELTRSLVGEDWLDQQTIWTGVRDLIYIRNELVHFKTAGYEQVVPPPASPAPIYSKVPKEVGLKDVPHSWPMRIITPALATWAVDATERIVDNFKDAYRASRRN